MHGLTQTCPIQHASVAIVIIINSPILREMCFPNFIQIFCFFRTHREMKMKLYWYSSILSNILKYNYSFLFVMIILSAAINKSYRYGSIILPTFEFPLDCSIKIWHARSYAGSITHSTRTFIVTVSFNKAPCRPQLEQRLRALLPL